MVIFGIVLVCCLCRCSPRKSESERENMAEVLEVVLYPDGAANNASMSNRITSHDALPRPISNLDGANLEVRTGGDDQHQQQPAQQLIRSLNERHFQYRYYPLQAGEQRPVTAVVAGSAPTCATEPFVGTVVAAADGRGDEAARVASEPASYGEAAYVSAADLAALQTNSLAQK